MKEFFRNLWLEIPRNDIRRRTVLAIVHGIVERSDEPSLESASEWLSDIREKILNNSCADPKDVEAEARRLNCGLQVFDPDRDPVDISAFFGVVESVEEGIADISFKLRESTGNVNDHVNEAVEVPIVDLLFAYSIPGVWVAWIERNYGGAGSKGRFEPAGTLPKKSKFNKPIV